MISAAYIYKESMLNDCNYKNLDIENYLQRIIFRYPKPRSPTIIMEVKPYLLTDEQVLEMVANPNAKVKQPKNKYLNGKHINLVLRAKKLRSGTGGVIAYKLNKIWRKVEINYSKDPNSIYDDIIIPQGVLYFKDGDKYPPKIKCYWESFFCS